MNIHPESSLDVTPDMVSGVPKYTNPKKRGHGAFIPNWLLIRTEISAGAKLCYSRLGRYFNERRGCAWPNQDLLAEEMGTNRRQVQRWLNELVEWQLITVRQRGLKKTNEYRFLLHEWEFADDSGCDNLSHLDTPDLSHLDTPDLSHPIVTMSGEGSQSSDELLRNSSSSSGEEEDDFLKTVAEFYTLCSQRGWGDPSFAAPGPYLRHLQGKGDLVPFDPEPVARVVERFSQAASEGFSLPQRLRIPIPTLLPALGSLASELDRANLSPSVLRRTCYQFLRDEPYDPKTLLSLVANDPGGLLKAIDERLRATVS